MHYPTPNLPANKTHRQPRLGLAALDLGQDLVKLTPVLHDHDSPRVGQHLDHLLPLLLLVGADIANDLDAGTGAAQGPALAVLDGDALLGLLAELLHGI